MASPNTTVDVSARLTENRKPLPALTGIRFLAAMQVVFFHFGSSFALRHSATRPLGNLLANGWIAVSLFFILSGFILSYTYAGHIESPGGKRRFWAARFARIYPVYVLSLVLMLPFQSSLPIGLAVAVVTMVQAWNPSHPNFLYAWNLTAWTLSIEAFFYLVFPFLLVFVEKMSSRALKALLGMTLLVMAFGHTITHFIEPLSQRAFIPLPLFRLPEFFTGLVLGLLFLRSRSVRHNSIRIYISLFAIIAVLLAFRERWLSLIVIPYAILIYELAACDCKISRLLGSRIFVLLGGASYAVYLLQVPVRSWVHFALTGTKDLNVNHSGLDAVLSPALLICLSILVFLYWEEPARRWLRSWFKRNVESGISAMSSETAN
jgi:peptidoglycan/LPS O-acetylase OafA/YrhL